MSPHLGDIDSTRRRLRVDGFQFDLAAPERLDGCADRLDRHEVIAIELFAVLLRHHPQHVGVRAGCDHAPDRGEPVPLRRVDAMVTEGQLVLAGESRCGRRAI
jgi:hypothetical protein